jgi:hypothetical protein
MRAGAEDSRDGAGDEANAAAIVGDEDAFFSGLQAAEGDNENHGSSGDTGGEASVIVRAGRRHERDEQGRRGEHVCKRKRICGRSDVNSPRVSVKQ